MNKGVWRCWYLLQNSTKKRSARLADQFPSATRFAILVAWDNAWKGNAWNMMSILEDKQFLHDNIIQTRVANRAIQLIREFAYKHFG